MKERRKDLRRRNKFLAAATLICFLGGISILWVASLRIPALEDISERKVVASTQIYDRTGEILLYDLSQGVKRELVPMEAISDYAKQATIAIEDKNFYEHKGIKLSSFFRALLVNISTLSFSQGGSTITQQVVKNSILTKDKTPTRKLKEWILAVKLEDALSKDEILNFYLNEIPYGGPIYGIQEASEAFFGKSASDLTLAESAYLAALPKAPTYYSPYGSHRDALEDRKNLVLSEMLSLGFITEEEYNAAREEVVEFQPRKNTGSLKAPHFVFYVIDKLAEKYGEDTLQEGGFKVITTLDYSIQLEAEKIAKKYGEINEKNFNGSNNAFVVIDPKTGDILSMVGSRDYFDDAIEGNFNVATAHRQPGSAFKPIVYAEMLNKGYTTETVLFDAPTQFSTACAVDNFTSEGNCYSPGNYDDKFRGPMTMRNALAQSINVPAVQGLYLAGVKDSLNLAKAMGIDSLEDADRYGLTLVLGGGEVSLVDMVGAYGVFAADGMRAPHNPILRVEDGNGDLVDAYRSYPERVLPEQTARGISSILSDNAARAPLYGPGSVVNIPGRDVAVKTGTTNDYRDAWIIGYTPSIAVGAWVGNNDNSPMQKKVSGLIVAPMWRELMDTVLPKVPYENLPVPEPEDPSLKPVLLGQWDGQHSILHWVNRSDPRGPAPSNPAKDPQYRSWEYAVSRWAARNPTPIFNPTTPAANPTDLNTQVFPPYYYYPVIPGQNPQPTPTQPTDPGYVPLPNEE